MKASSLIPRVSRFLSDQVSGEEYSRWTETDLFDAFIWAVQWLAAAQPDSFVQQVDLKLAEGSYQPLPSCCNKIASVVGNARPVTRRALRLVDASRRCPPSVRGNRPYTVTEYTYDADAGPNTLYVYPPVPKSAVGSTFPLICQYDPAPDSIDDDLETNPSVDAVVFSLMVYYVGTGENESPTLRAVAESHFEKVATALRLERQVAAQDDQKERQDVADEQR